MTAYDARVLERAQQIYADKGFSDDYPFFLDDNVLVVEGDEIDDVIAALRIVTQAREDVILDDMIKKESEGNVPKADE